MNGFYFVVSASTFVVFLQIISIQGDCLTFSNISAVVYRRPNVAKVSWTTQKTGCLVTNWMVHYDSVAPVRIFQNRNQSGNRPDVVTYIPVQPNFAYQIYVEAFTDNGQVLKSPVVAYSAPKDRPYKSPARFRTTGITYNSIGLAWDKLDLFSKNGDVKGYGITFKDVTGGFVNTRSVIGENVTMTTLTNLRPNHSYQLVIQCINDKGAGPFSSPPLKITLPPKPPPITATTSTTRSATTPTTRTTKSPTTSLTLSSSLSSTASTTRSMTPLTSSSALSTSNVPQSTNKPDLSSASTLLSTVSTTTMSSLPRTPKISPSNAITTPKTNPRSNSSPSTALAVTKFPTSKSTTLAIATSVQTSTSAGLRKSTPTEKFIREPASSNTTKDDVSLWMIIAIALGCAVLLLVMVLCCLCPRFCYPVAAVDSKRNDNEKALRKKMAKRRKLKRCEDRTMAYSGNSLESVDDSDYDDLPYRQSRRYSNDSQFPLTTTFATPMPRHKKKSSKRKVIPPLNNVGVTIGTQYNESVSIGTQYGDGIPFYKHGRSVLSPSPIHPLAVQPSKVFTIPTSIENTMYDGLSNFRNQTQVDTNPDKKGVSFNNRRTSPALIEYLSNNKVVPSGLNRAPYRCRNRGTSPIQELIPSQDHHRNTSMNDSFPVNAPQLASADNKSHSVQKIEYNTIYRNHVNNTDNTIIQNLIPSNREPPASKPPLPMQYQEHPTLHTHENSSDEEKMTRLGKSNFCDETFDEGPLPRVILFEPKKQCSEC